MVDQEVSQHGAAEGPADERHHHLSPVRPPLSPNRRCEDATRRVRLLWSTAT
jgi:hypothetical protein